MDWQEETDAEKVMLKFWTRSALEIKQECLDTKESIIQTIDQSNEYFAPSVGLSPLKEPVIAAAGGMYYLWWIGTASLFIGLIVMIGEAQREQNTNFFLKLTCPTLIPVWFVGIGGLVMVFRLMSF